MARFEVSGLDELQQFFDDVLLLPDSVTDDMLRAEADIVVEAEKQTASTMLQGPYYQGAVAGSIQAGAIKKTGDGKALDVVFSGRQHGESLARIAYINEFGKTNQPARPFIKTAVEQSADRAVEAAADVLQKHINSK